MISKLLPICSLILLLTVFHKQASSQIIINEINYHSSEDFDTKDWLEFHNAGENLVNIGFWYFKDDNEANVFAFPEGTTIEAGGYLVVCRNIENFTTFWPDVDNYIGEFDFGLNNGGELIRLFNSSGTVVDTVSFDDESPWPTDPDGFGPTLQLNDPASDNALAENWYAATGTPGAPNMPNDIRDPEFTEIALSVFPNPATDAALVKINSDQLTAAGKLMVFNSLGHLVKHISLSGSSEFSLEVGNFPAGIYTLRLVDEQGMFSGITKFVIVR